MSADEVKSLPHLVHLTNTHLYSRVFNLLESCRRIGAGQHGRHQDMASFGSVQPTVRIFQRSLMSAGAHQLFLCAGFSSYGLRRFSLAARHSYDWG